MTPLSLTTPVNEVFMVGPTYAQRLKKLNILTVEDLLRHYPNRYEDYSIIAPISSVQMGEIVTIKGIIVEIKNIYTKYGKNIQQAKISDDTGRLDVVWYNQSYLTKILHPGQTIFLSGKIASFKNNLSMISPEYEIDRGFNIHTGRLVPIYPETYGVSSKWLRSRINPLLQRLKSSIEEFLPSQILLKNNLLEENEAIAQIHFPDSIRDAHEARNRLSFDELFLIQLASLKRKKEWQREIVGHQFEISPHKEKLNNFIAHLPFTLTRAQQRSAGEILTDLAQKTPMNRLLEGEVGSGKTVVATIAAFMAHLNGFEVALMAPTEILAQQHYQTVSSLLAPQKINVGLITGSNNLKTKDQRRKTNDYDIYIGTHALLSKNIKFKDLGLVIIDEQQRFGVEQRATLKEKGINPHLLTMTATPIPRTTALTLYGELDLSLIDELPQERKVVKTWVVPPEKRGGAYGWIEKQITATRSQVFIICPLIEESESLTTVKAAKVEFEKLKNEVFPHLSLGLLHGKMKVKEKKSVLTDFKDQKIDILVATPIVEVGIDIPNATIIMIEAADRFGLTQLHQLRGRVGRGNKQSYCLLFSETENDATLQRLKALETNHIGAILAEIDLTLRGPGDMYGTRQHGASPLKIARLSDRELVDKTQKEAKQMVNSSLELLNKSGPLQRALKKYTIKRVTQD